MRGHYIVLGLLFVSINSFAQSRTEKFLMYSQEGDEFLRSGNAEKAIRKYRDAYDIVKDKKSKSNAYFNIGLCYEELDNRDKLIEYMLKSLEVDNNNFEALKHIAEIHQINGEYELAIINYNKYLSRRPFSKDAQAGLRSSKAALRWKDDPQNAELNLVYDLSSELDDVAMTFINPENTELILISSRGGTSTDKSLQPSIYYSELKQGNWTKPRLIDLLWQSSGRVNSVCYSKNRSIIFFSKCQLKGNKTYDCDIFYGFMQGGMKGEVKRVELKNGEDFNVFQPSYSDELDALFFVSDKYHNLNDSEIYTDIWYSKYNTEEDTWSEPVQLGPEVNSDIDEYYPSVHPNGDLYFSSLGHTGLGGMDIFVSKKTGDMKWGSPENLKAPINSSNHDYRIIFNSDNSSGYFSSERKEGYGGSDIFSFKFLDAKDHVDPTEKPDVHMPVYNTLNEEEATIETLRNIFNNDMPMKCPGNADIYELTILPNPNTGVFAWQFKSMNTYEFTVKIYDTSGKVLYFNETGLEAGTIRNKIDLSEYGKGIYYLTVSSSSGEVVCDKVIVE